MKPSIILLAVIFSLTLLIAWLWQVKVTASNVIIEVYDVSPLNGVEVSEYITKEYSKCNATIYLFIIPNHGYVADISQNEGFLSNLGELANHAKLCIHGYSHSNEDFSNVSFTKDRISLIKSFLRNSTLNFSSCFAPPFWRYSQQSLNILAKRFEVVFLKDFVIYRGKPKNTISIQAPLRNSKILWFLTLLYAKFEITRNNDSNVIRITFHEGNSVDLINFLLRNLLKI